MKTRTLAIILIVTLLVFLGLGISVLSWAWNTRVSAPKLPSNRTLSLSAVLICKILYKRKGSAVRLCLSVEP